MRWLTLLLGCLVACRGAPAPADPLARLEEARHLHAAGEVDDAVRVVERLAETDDRSELQRSLAAGLQLLAYSLPIAMTVLYFAAEPFIATFLPEYRASIG